MGNMDQKKKVNIVVELAECMNARSFESEKIIHQTEFIKCKKLIENKIEMLLSIDKNSENDNVVRARYNDTITILGARGSGKTSFLRSVLNHYNNKENPNIEILSLVDPTLIEEKGHIFLTLISLINSKVEEAISKAECNPCSKEHQNRSCWEKQMKKLAAGLPYIGIDNNSLYSNWHDPEHVMKKGLECVKAAKELEENFEKVVKYALKILGKKAFLIAFDDIDVNFDKGWQVLETIRKYLTSPHIITLLSGDIKLFSKAIRKNQWNSFGNNLLTYEGEKLKRIDQFDDMVTELESQYLQKIMKTPNRIHLLTIGELIGKNRFEISINKKKDSIYNYYINLLKNWALTNKYASHAIATYLLTLPLRTQIQILKQYDDYNKEKVNNASLMNITDVFVSDMYELGIDVEQAKSQHKDLCYIAHNFLIKEELLNETYQLLPTSGSAKCNATLFSLNTMFVEHSKGNPYMFFEYWITIATIKNMLTIMPYRSDLKKDVSLLPAIEGLAEYSFIGQNKVFRDICSYLSTYIRATLDFNSDKIETNAPWGGTLILKGLAVKAKGSAEEVEDRIDKVFKTEELLKRQLAFFPMSIASVSRKQETRVVYSFYTLLGTIVELLKRYNVLKEDNFVTSDVKNKETWIIDNIAVLINELSQIKENVMPAFEKSTPDKSAVSNNDESEEVSFEDKPVCENSELAKVIYQWMEKCPTIVPAHLIGKIATRAFYAIRRLDDKKYEGDYQKLGDAVHRRLIIVMNSALLEDAKEHLSICDLSNDNPREKNKIFFDNLKKIFELELGKNNDVQNLKFSRWLLGCPLFLLYLDIESLLLESQEFINDLLKNEKMDKDSEFAELGLLSFFMAQYKSDKKNEHSEFDIEWIKNNSIYHELQQVSVHNK